MAAIRAVVVTISPIIADIITTVLSRKAAMEVVANFSDRTGIEPQLAAVAPDLILIGLQQGELHQISCPLLEIVPRAMVIAFSNDGRNAHVHEMRAHSTMSQTSPLDAYSMPSDIVSLEAISTPELLKAIRPRLRSSAVTELGPAAFCWRVMRRGRARMACLGPGQIANLCHENSFSADVGHAGSAFGSRVTL